MRPGIYPGNWEGNCEGQYQSDYNWNRVFRIGEPVYPFFDVSKRNGRINPGVKGCSYKDAFALLGDVMENFGEYVKNCVENQKPGDIVNGETYDDVVEHRILLH